MSAEVELSERTYRCQTEQLHSSRQIPSIFSVCSGSQSHKIAKIDLDKIESNPTKVKWTAKKIAIKALLWIAASIIYCITFIPTLGSRVYFWVKRKDFHRDLALSRLEALKRGLDIKWCENKNILQMNFDQLSQNLDGDREKIEKFIVKVQNLVTLIKDPPPRYRSYQRHVEEKIRPLLSSLATDEIYQKNKFMVNPAVDFIQALSAELYVGARGEKTFREMGEKEAGHLFTKEKSEFDFNDLKKALDESVIKQGNLNKNNFGETLLYALHHPFKVIHAIDGSKFDKLGYNSCAIGNGYNTWGNLSLDGQSIVHVLGPNVAGDNVYDIYMDFLQKHNSLTLRHDLQGINKAGEDLRILKVTKKSLDRKNQLIYFRTDFDGPIWKMTSTEMCSFALPEKFMSLYRERVTEDGGHRDACRKDGSYYLNRETLSDNDLNHAFDYSQKLFTRLLSERMVSRKLWDKLVVSLEGRKRLGKVMQFTTQGFMSAAVLVKTLRHMPQRDFDKQMDGELRYLANSVCFGQACKQDIDRGIVHNILTRLFFKALNGQNLTKTDIFSIVGAANRAIAVDRRKMLLGRYKPFSDFLELIGDKQGMAILQDVIKEFEHKINPIAKAEPKTRALNDVKIAPSNPASSNLIAHTFTWLKESACGIYSFFKKKVGSFL